MTKSFRVIKIINDMKIVINAGSEDFIERGSKLEVYTPGEEVIDPETNESLGTLDTIKAYLEVIHIFPKMCICQNAEIKTYSTLPSINITFTRQERSSLKVDAKQITGGYNNGDKVIRIGDLARQSIG